ncbi:MAG: ABC transporter permease [Thermaerobacter sp.]|nr:peptide ABC transporter [Bacillota bacterium]
MGMRSFILQRLIQSVVVLLGLSLLIFVLVRVAPGDPVRAALGPRVPQDVVDRMRAEMMLDEPYHIQYIHWITRTLQGDFGNSLMTRRPVAEDIKQFLPATMELALFAGVFMAAFGILLGAASAYRRNSWLDNAIRVLAYTGVVTPAFVFAVLFLLLFGYYWHVFPTAGRLAQDMVAPPTITGMVTVDSLLTGNWRAFVDGLKHLVLPAVALSMAGLSQQARITRASLVDNLQKDFVLAHRTYGLSDRSIMLKYALKPSLIPTVSILGLDFAALLSNAFLVELIFNWPGLSRYGVNAILQKDVNAVAAVVMVLGVTFVTVNILVDIVVAWLDPRIRMRIANQGG